MAQETLSTNLLFSQFLTICNQAMEAHRDDFPYKYIWEAVEQIQQDGNIHITLYDDMPKGDYRLRLQEKHLEMVDMEAESNHPGWRMNLSYLQQVVNDPQRYIDDPSQLDWNWLKRAVEP